MGGGQVNPARLSRILTYDKASYVFDSHSFYVENLDLQNITVVRYINIATADCHRIPDHILSSGR